MQARTVSPGQDPIQPIGERRVTLDPNLAHAMLRPASLVGGRNPNVKGRDPVLRAVADR